MIDRAKFNDDYRKAVCRIGQGADCCRYLTLSAMGWDCERNTTLGIVLDFKAECGSITAKGQNCEGLAPTENPTAATPAPLTNPAVRPSEGV